MKKAEKLIQLTQHVEEINSMVERHTKEFRHLQFYEDIDYANLPAPLINEAYKWIIGIMQGPFRKMQVARALLKEDQWDNYYAMYDDFKDMRESVMLRDAAKGLTLAIKERPIMFRSKEVLLDHSKTVRD